MMVLPELLVSTSLLSIALLLWGVIGSWWKEECRVPVAVVEGVQRVKESNEEEDEEEEVEEVEVSSSASSEVSKTEIEERFNALVRSLGNVKRKTTELEHAKKIASLPCVHCETLFLSCDRPQCTHSRRPNLRTLIETKKETELRERREKVEKGRARKVRTTSMT